MAWKNLSEDIEEMFGRMIVPSLADFGSKASDKGFSIEYWDGRQQYLDQGGADHSLVRIGGRVRRWARKLTVAEVKARRSAAGTKTGRLMAIRKPCAKLSAEQVKEIRSTRGMTQQAMADKYKVSRSAIRWILYERNWK